MNATSTLAHRDPVVTLPVAEAPGVYERLSAWRASVGADFSFIVDVRDRLLETSSALDVPQVDVCVDDVLAISQRSIFKAKILMESDCSASCDAVHWFVTAPVFVGGRLAKVLGFCGFSRRGIELGVTDSILIDTYASWLGAHLLKTVSCDRIYTDLTSMRSIIDATSEAILALDDVNRIVFANAAAERLVGERLAILHGKPIVDVFELKDGVESVSVADLSDLVAVTGSPLTIEAQAVSLKSGALTRIDGRVLPASNVTTGMISSIVALRDIEATADLQKQLDWQFSHDQLTGVSNRFEMESKINDVFSEEREGRLRASLVHFGVDGLELVNNLCGIAGGDDLLKKIALMLDGLAKPMGGKVARVGGDEFAALFSDVNLRGARDFAQKALDSLVGIFEWAGEDISITMSAGVVPLRPSLPSADDVLLASATALRLAKDGGRSEIRVMRTLKEGGENVSDLQTISMIRRALDQKRLALLSQRIQPLAKAKHKAMHHEILVRIRSESGGLISPDQFIPAAERNHLMPLLDKAILSAALESVKLFPVDDILSINLSGKTISYPGIYEYIRDKLISTEVDPQRICFEVTETAAISNETLAIEFIKNIKSLGCMISLDDFGTGHHSFRLMKEMAPEFIKIDGAFVRQMFKGDGFDTAAIRSIVDVADKINAEVIAESVENEETMKALAEMGVSFVQGWHIHRPELIQGF